MVLARISGTVTQCGTGVTRRKARDTGCDASRDSDGPEDASSERALEIRSLSSVPLGEGYGTGHDTCCRERRHGNREYTLR